MDEARHPAVGARQAAAQLASGCVLLLAACAETPPSSVSAPTQDGLLGMAHDAAAVPACPDGKRSDDGPLLAWIRTSSGRIATVWLEPGSDGPVERTRVDAAVVVGADGIHVMRIGPSEVISCDTAHRCSVRGFPPCPRPKIETSQRLWAVPVGSPSQPASVETVRPSHPGCPAQERSMHSFRGVLTLAAAFGSTVYYEASQTERWGDPAKDVRAQTMKAYDVARPSAGSVELAPAVADLAALRLAWRQCLTGSWVDESRDAELVGVSRVPLGIDAAPLLAQFGRISSQWPSAPPFRSRRGRNWCDFAGWTCPDGVRCIHEPELGCGPEVPGCAGQCEELPPEAAP